MNLPEITIPDIESPAARARIRESKLAHYVVGADFHMNNWPAALWSLSFGPNILIPFPASDFIHVADGQVRPSVKLFFNELDAILCGNPWFIRLNTRSPKDMAYPNAPIVKTGDEALNMLGGSMRVFDDCCDLYDIEKPVFLVLRKPMVIPPRYEFRCFVKARELIAMTQYFYDQVFEGLAGERAQVEKKIGEFHKRVADVLPLQDYVFDVFFADGDADPTLIEINPYGMSDPYLFETYANVEKGGFLIKDGTP